MDRAEVAGDQKDDIVEIGVVVEARDPRLIRRADVGSRCEREEDRNQSKASEPVQSDFPNYHCHCHPTAEEGPGRNGRAFTSNYWLLSTGCALRDCPSGRGDYFRDADY